VRYLERPLTQAIGRLERAPQRMLTVIGTGFVIAAVAGALGFSLAIGAFFAGLVFSRDPVAIKTEGRLDDLYAFFVPFFFIGIGLQTDLGALDDGLGLGLWLLAAAIAGKLLGAGLLAMGVTSASGAALIGVSMVPRAEIAMVVADQGRAGGLLAQGPYAALVLVSAATCVLTPWLIHAMLARWPRAAGARPRGHHP
jgi:Kef-type K+ transport system membrane component KefB